MPEDDLATDADARAVILRHLYERAGQVDESADPTQVHLLIYAGAYSRDIGERAALPHEAIHQAALDLMNENLVSFYTWDQQERGFLMRITPAGVLAAEEWGVVDAERRRGREAAALAMLRHLASPSGPREKGCGADRFELEEAGGGGADARRAVPVLAGSGLLAPDPLFEYYFHISQEGRRHLRDLETRERERAAFAARLAALEAICPQEPGRAQERGRALEQLLVDALRYQECCCSPDTGGKGEQIDLAIEAGPSFFVAEVKWKEQRVGGAVIDQMVGRVTRRPGIADGVIFSMSGFTDGARRNAASASGHRMVLLFDGEETRSIIRQERWFDDIAQEKTRALVTREAAR